MKSLEDNNPTIAKIESLLKDIGADFHSPVRLVEKDYGFEVYDANNRLLTILSEESILDIASAAKV